FLGAHPATVREGPHKRLRPLGAAEDLARQLMAALSEEQRRGAIIAERAFGDIVASPGRERDLAQPVGLALSAIDGTAPNLGKALGLDGSLEILQPAAVELVDPAVHRDLLAASPGLQQDRVAADVAHLLDDVELAQGVDPVLAVGQRVETGLVLAAELADAVQ